MTRDDKLALAGDYVLGLLSDDERTACEVAMTADPELAAMIEKLGTRMNTLDATVSPADYDIGLWRRIEQRLEVRPTDKIVPLAPRRRPLTIPRHWLPIAASIALAIGLGYFAGFSARPSDQPTMIAIMLNESDGNPAVIVEAFADDSIRLVPLESFAAPSGQVLQVWTLPDVATGPVSLGTLETASDLRLAGPNLPLPQNGQLYEITLEPAPGSPTGRPTGPILVKGFAKQPI